MPATRYNRRMSEATLCPPPELRYKGGFGSDSEAGSRFAERLLTVIATCGRLGRGLPDYLVAAGEAALRGGPPPSLLPALQGS
jgi:hypothetical protein